MPSHEIYFCTYDFGQELSYAAVYFAYLTNLGFDIKSNSICGNTLYHFTILYMLELF